LAWCRPTLAIEHDYAPVRQRNDQRLICKQSAGGARRLNKKCELAVSRLPRCPIPRVVKVRRQRRGARRGRRRPEADRATAPRCATSALVGDGARGTHAPPRPRPATRPRRSPATTGWLGRGLGASWRLRRWVAIPAEGWLGVSHAGKPRACPALLRRHAPAAAAERTAPLPSGQRLAIPPWLLWSL
jgi:hypothetical protein